MSELSERAQSALNGNSMLCTDHPDFIPDSIHHYAEHLNDHHDDPTLLNQIDQHDQEG